MKKIGGIIKIVSQVAKYAAVLIIIGETFKFMQEKLAEQFPAEIAVPGIEKVEIEKEA